MITKQIWMYWDQGWDHAPDLVKECKNSWIRLNPDYEMHTLDQTSLFDYIDFPVGIDIRRKDLTIQKVANLARLALLSKHGGVCADATLMCVKPLSEWIEEYYESQFFAFRNPGTDRLMSNWFIAAESENIILRRLYNQGTALGKVLLKKFGRYWNKEIKTSLKWHSWFARKVLRIYPYFIFHYTFNKLIHDDPECAKLWNDAKPFSAEAPHLMKRLESAVDGIAKAKREIDNHNTPMYKLSWRVDSSNSYWSAIIPYLRGQP